MGGEKSSSSLVGAAVRGSPPRGRGKGAVEAPAPACEGITPAWAGKSRESVLAGAGWRDHPRVGGEKEVMDTGQALTRGSPPRGRGKELENLRVYAVTGITPAWAGKSPQWRTSCSASGDHPRVGGEKKPKLGPRNGTPGSPPRGRGKEVWPFCSWVYSGITPAWAGKSGVGSHAWELFWDHPRVGGEKFPLTRFGFMR